MAFQPLITPTVRVIGNGAVTPAAVAAFDYQNPNPPYDRVSEACWKFTATPGATAQLVSMMVRCVFKGMSSLSGSTYDLTSDVTKAVTSGYTSYWFEPIQGETPDTSTAFWVLSTDGGAPVIDGVTFYNGYCELFEVVAVFTGSNLILRDPDQVNAIMRANAAHGDIILRDA